MEDIGSKRNELRSTETLYLRVRPEVRQRALDEGEQSGLSISEYVAGLIMGKEPIPRLAVEIGSLAVLGQRVVAALAQMPPEAIETREAVVVLRRAIVDLMLARRAGYDTRLDRRGAEGRWG
ncbi:MAG: hypothetical protein WB681_05640 [Candidatus Cybelea sp.]